jgi:hypothetical protein
MHLVGGMGVLSWHDNPICRTGPPGLAWRNRFLGSINVNKYGLCTLGEFRKETFKDTEVGVGGPSQLGLMMYSMLVVTPTEEGYEDGR